MEVLLWHSGIGGASAVLGSGSIPGLHRRLRVKIQHCCSSSIGSNYGSDLIPGPRALYAAG